MSDTTRWQEVKELAVVEAHLATTVSGTDPGHWLDFSGCGSIRISVSGTISAGTYDILACELLARPLDTDNAHPSLLQGLSGSQLNWLQFAAAPHWVKFITTGVTGSLSCGATAERKSGWNR